jgi:hypothetical protein
LIFAIEKCELASVARRKLPNGKLWLDTHVSATLIRSRR